jgi:hypothetical protein
MNGPLSLMTWTTDTDFLDVNNNQIAAFVGDDPRPEALGDQAEND